MPQVRVAVALAVFGVALVGCGESHAREEVPAMASGGSGWSEPEVNYPIDWEVISGGEGAYGTFEDARSKVPGGWLVRSLHHRSIRDSQCVMNGMGNACGLAGSSFQITLMNRIELRLDSPAAPT